jgi:hypothetical protein
MATPLQSGQSVLMCVPHHVSSIRTVFSTIVSAQIADVKHDGESDEAFEDWIVKDHGGSME